MWKLLLGVLAGLLLAHHSGGANDDHAEKIADITAQSSMGLIDLFNLDFEEALSTFRGLEENYPIHPAPPLYGAIVIWQRELFRRRDLKLDRFVSPGYFTESARTSMPPVQRQAFLENIQKSMSLSREILVEDPDHTVAKYFLGAAEGVMASFKITIDRSKMDAFAHGKRAYKLHKQVIEANPEFYDAYSTVGVYEYIADNLPWYVKWIAVITGFSGDEEKGLEYLRISSEKSPYSSDDARVMLMVLLVREKKYQEALGVAEGLHRKYSKNFLFHLNRAQILEKMDRQEEALREYQEVLESADVGRPHYDLVELPALRFKVAEEAFDLKEFQIAKNHFDQLAGREEVESRQRAISLMRLGQIQDLQGNRGQALTRYREVLEREELSEWHDDAENFLKQPYRLE